MRDAISTTTTTENIFERFADLIAPRLRERRLDAERRADTDELTGLANRAAFNRAEGSATNDPDIVFVIFDANNFGLVNKSCGHQEGDRLLRFYADALGGVARKFKARAFRLGGDEFVILCNKRFAAQIRDCVEQRARPSHYGDFTVSISGEIGGTLAQADSKLQERKRLRKNQDVSS